MRYEVGRIRYFIPPTSCLIPHTSYLSMKILHFSSAKSWRGGEQQIAYLIEELEQLGVQQWIFCRKNSALADYCLLNNIRYLTYRRGFSVNPAIGLRFKKICSELRVDIAHLHDAHSHTFAYMSALLGNPTPYILSRRVDFRVQNSTLSLKKYNHSSIKKILSVSQKVQDVLSPAIRDSSKLKVVHSGIDLTRFSGVNTGKLREELQLSKTTKLIANVAAIAPHKDYFTFVDTAAILVQQRSDLKFLIIGSDGGEAEKIKQYIQEKQLVQHFIFTGFRKDIPVILPEIDVFLFTSKEEGLGTSLLDALASRVPVVATNAGGIPEIIQHQKNGLLASIGDAHQLAKNVQILLTQPSLATSLVKQGKETVQQFSKKQTARKTMIVYKEVLNDE